MKKFYLASSNQHKAEEFNILFKGAPIEIVPAPEKIEVVEDGETFYQNSLKKAQTYYQKLKAPVMADDSGLVVEERPDILGIHSARYAPEAKDYHERCSILLNDLKELAGEQRKAYFVCYLAFVISESEIYSFEGRMKGHIGSEVRGASGFGYDPVFVPEARPDFTLAELPDWKQEHSHRAKAVQAAISFFKGSFS